MSYLLGTRIPQNVPISQNIHLPAVNNPFAPGSVEYDAYQTGRQISNGVSLVQNRYHTTTSALAEAANDLIHGSDDSSGIDTTGMWTLYDPNSVPGSTQTLQYIDAPFAEHYGMDASTAYQEALANTAYQRKVKDLQAAGLNPVLGINGSGAASFYGSPAASSGGGMGSYGSAKSTAADKAESLQYWLPTLVNGVTNAIVSAKTKNGMTGYAAGTVAQNITYGVLGAIRNHS